MRIFFLCFFLLFITINVSAAPTPISLNTLKIYTWREDTARQLPGTTAMVWAKVNYGQLPQPRGADYHSARKPETVAEEVAKGLALLQPEDRALFFWHGGTAHGNENEPALFPDDDRNIDAYVRGGYTEFTTRWMTSFWQRLAMLQIKPSLIVLDYENADGIWGLKTNSLRDRDVANDVPGWATGIVSAMQSLQPVLKQSGVNSEPLNYVRQNGVWQLNQSTIVQFNNWQLARRAAALRSSIIEPANIIYNEQIASSNFSEQQRLWQGVDGNGWPLPQRSMSGTISSPVTYLGISGQRYSATAANQALEFRRALNWVDVRNDVRSALAINSVAPWYSNPDFGRDANETLQSHRLMWAAGLLHDRAFGTSIMLFWSANSWSTEEIAFAKPILAYLRTMPASTEAITKLPEDKPEAALNYWVTLAKRVVSGQVGSTE